jgi:HK97 family phage prohead protease
MSEAPLAAPPRVDKALTAPLTLKAGDDAGHVQALFSVYNTIDSVQDVVVPGAFLEGEEVPMAVNHDWGRLGVGKGVIRSSPQGAIFDGHFLLNTIAGREAYEHVKGMAGLQEWSFGFTILDSEPGRFEGVPVRFLKRVQLHEVSPVFKGANSHTATLAIKAAPEGLEGADALEEARTDFKAGRVLSEATRRRIQAVRDQWAAQLAELDQLLTDTAPAPRTAPDPDLLELRAQFAAFQTRYRDVIGEVGRVTRSETGGTLCPV